MRILICDDDGTITEQLSKYITTYFSKNRFSIPEIAVYSSGEALLGDAGEKDIVFLDVEMPGISGILTGKKLKQKHPNLIIFVVTSFAEYLDEAMRIHVFRYLSKPIDRQRLFQNMRDALELYHTANGKIVVETTEGTHSVPAADIICVEAQGKTVIVHTADSDYESVHPIKYWTETLTMSCFFQTHRSFIVNMMYVTYFDRTLISFHHYNFSAYLARRKYNEFKSAYLLYVESAQ